MVSCVGITCFVWAYVRAACIPCPCENWITSVARRATEWLWAGPWGGEERESASCGSNSDFLERAETSVGRGVVWCRSRYGVWLHIDGAWGGAVLMSDRLRPMLRGAELADSFCFNPHKLLGVPVQVCPSSSPSLTQFAIEVEGRKVVYVRNREIEAVRLRQGQMQ